MTLLPDFFIVSVYNMTDTDLAMLENKRALKICTKDEAILCSGEVDDIYRRVEGSNEVYEVSLSDGQTFWETTMNRSVGEGTTFSSTILNILTGAKMGSYLADDPRFIRPQAFHGRLADAIIDLAKGAHARAFISNNVVHVVAKGRSEVIVNINEDDIIDDPNYADGICVLKTGVDSWPVGMICEFRNKRYRLVTNAISADNFKGDWQEEITLVDEDYLDANGMDGG